MKERLIESFVLTDGVPKSIERYQAGITAIRCSQIFIKDEFLNVFSEDSLPKNTGKVWLFTPDSRMSKAHLSAFKMLTVEIKGKLIKGEREDSWVISYGTSFIEILREEGFFVKELWLG